MHRYIFRDDGRITLVLYGQNQHFKCQEGAFNMPIFWHFKRLNLRLKHLKRRLSCMKWTPILMVFDSVPFK